MLKARGSSATDYWMIQDTQRSTSNVCDEKLAPNVDSAQNGTNFVAGTNEIDILSNGFKLRNSDTGTNSSNTSYSPYLYMAFAEAPTNNLFGGQATAR